jgi:Cft2 family RNA processing exonuclease
MNVCYRRGVHLPDVDLWLDPQDRKPVAVVSHAHSDHIGAHGHVLTSAGTAALMRHRLPVRTGGRADRSAPGSPASRARSRYQTLPFGRPCAFPRFELTLYPAGHVLGSAQALVETSGGRLLYSGDFKLRPSLSSEPIEVPPADVVVMETTFGRPRYVFPPTEQVVAEIRDFCRRALEEGAVPVLFAYALGKGPELVAQLAGCGWDLVLHHTLFDIVKLYEAMGVRFPAHRRLMPGAPLDGCVLICPPGAARSRALEALPRRRTAYVSGWALERGAAYRYGADACFPLSDHADYPDLLEYVRRTGARRIYTLHGFDAEFAQDLRLMGYDAHCLSAPAQLPLL